MSAPLLQVEGLTKQFHASGGLFGRQRSMTAVREVDLTVGRGEVVGVVGESGCGKSTLARLVLRLIEPTAGRITLDGTDLTALSPAALRAARRRMSIVFQDPYSSLDPRYAIADILAEPFVVQSRPMPPDTVDEMLDAVGLPQSTAKQYPHQLSGGQRQRIGIARALALRPEFVVLDEPTASLDVSIQAQIIALLSSLRDRFGLTYLFISHDLGLVRYFCNRIVVMYLGQVMEQGGADAVFSPPYHPYTEALLSAIPIADSSISKRKVVLSGEMPSPSNPPAGCPFSTRCPYVLGELCREKRPPVHEFSATHKIACHLPRERLLAMQPVIAVPSEAPDA